MYSQIDTSKLTRAGRFLLDDIVLVSYQSADGSNKNAKSILFQLIFLILSLYQSHHIIFDKQIYFNYVINFKMYIHNLNPVIFDLGFLSLKWYSLAYIIGIVFGWWYGKKIISLINNRGQNNYDLNLFDDFITYVIISIIIGGRLGYVFFYNSSYFIANPIEIFFIWNGGMSFHGGLIGLIVATIIFSKKKNFNNLVLLDVVACVAPIGIFFGRLANFINGELYGKPTDLPWAVTFPLVDPQARHPSQIYEALLELSLIHI